MWFSPTSQPSKRTNQKKKICSCSKPPVFISLRLKFILINIMRFFSFCSDNWPRWAWCENRREVAQPKLCLDLRTVCQEHDVIRPVWMWGCQRTCRGSYCEVKDLQCHCPAKLRWAYITWNGLKHFYARILWAPLVSPVFYMYFVFNFTFTKLLILMPFCPHGHWGSCVSENLLV